MSYRSEHYVIAQETQKTTPKTVEKAKGLTKYQMKGTKYTEPPQSLKTIIEEKAEKHGIDPNLMSAISYCESDYNIKAQNKNTNSSIDGGVAQLNSVHLPELNRLGLDRFNPSDAYEFMAILIKRNGTSDYLASKSCWDIAVKVARR